MELELSRNYLSCYDTILDTTVFHEETLEMIVPDACPDILRVVNTAGTVCLHRKEAQESRAEVTAEVKCAVLYLPDGEDGIRRMEATIPFTCTADHGGIKPSCTIVAVPRVQCVDTHIINPRKVLIRVNVAVCIRVYGATTMNLCAGTAGTQEHQVEQLKEDYTTYMVGCVQEKSFTVQDDFVISGSRPAAAELLMSRAKIICNESKIIGNKLIFKGEILLRVLYRSTAGALCSTDHTLPFSQIMEISEVGEEAACTLDPALTELSCTLTGEDGRTLSVSMELLVQGVLRETRSIALLRDAYGIDCVLTPELCPYQLYHLAEQGSKRQTAREMLELDAPIKSIVDAYVTIGPLTQTQDGVHKVLTAQTALTVVSLTEGEELVSDTRSGTVDCPLELAAEADCSFQCRCNGEVLATPTTDGIEVRFDVDFTYLALSGQRVTGITGMRMDEAPARDSAKQPSLVLRMVGAERLWEIAKAYRTTMVDIQQANDLGEADALNGRLLLIPQKREAR